MIKQSAVMAVAAMLIVGIADLSAHAADNLQGTWEVRDSNGNPFDIVLLADGKAASTLHPDQTGIWQEQASTAVVRWSTGWVSIIAKDDGHYAHSAYRQGQPLNGSPNNTSEAEKRQ